MKLTKIPKLKSGDDAEAAQRLKGLVSEAQNGLRRVVALGLYCYEIKAGLAHGQFQKWLKAHCPDVSLRSLQAFMQLTAGVLSKCKISVKGVLANAQSLRFSHSGQLLTLPDSQIPDSARPLREKICSLIDGKTQSQLFLEFKQFKEDDDDLKPKRGRRKGEGGASKAQRDAAKLADEKAQIAADELDAADFCKWIDQVCEIGRLPKISDKVWDKLQGRAKDLHDFMRRVSASRKGGAQ